MSYLISTGSINNFAVRPAALPEIKNSKLRNLLKNNITNFGALNRMTGTMSDIPFIPVSVPAPAGVMLQSITLHKGFEVFLQNCFNKTNEIYFLAWAWDLSGDSPVIFPETNAGDLENWIFPMKKGNCIETPGGGFHLLPKKGIKGGAGVHVEVWESDKDIQQTVETILEVTEAIHKSALTKILTGLTNIYSPQIGLIHEAVSSLSKAIGEILKRNAKDYVGLFEGYYDADNWAEGLDLQKTPKKGNPACEIVLKKY